MQVERGYTEFFTTDISSIVSFFVLLLGCTLVCFILHLLFLGYAHVPGLVLFCTRVTNAQLFVLFLQLFFMTVPFPASVYTCFAHVT